MLFGMSFLLVSCGTVKEDEGIYENKDERRREGRERSRSQGGGDPETDEGGDTGSFSASPYEGDNSQEAVEEPSSAVKAAKTETVRYRGAKRNLSNKIDFLFLVDGSDTTRPFLSRPIIGSTFRSFINKLEEKKIDWRFYFVSARAFGDKKPSRIKGPYDGKPSRLERDGAFILTNYLSQDNLKPYSLNKTDVHSVFIDTLSYNQKVGSKPSSKPSCEFPPFCHKESENRPLRAFHLFLSNFSDNLRENADLVSIVISAGDEKPLSRKDEPMDALNIITKFNQIFPEKNFFAVSIVVKAGKAEACGEKSKLQAATFIPGLSLVTQGLVINICSRTPEGYGTPIIEFLNNKKKK